MGDLQYFDIILFAMIAAFLFCGCAACSENAPGMSAAAISFRAARRRLRKSPAPTKWRSPTPPDKVTPISAIAAKSSDTLDEGLSRIRRADPAFDPAHFLEGAKLAFEMIVTAFAKGDKAVLRPLLSDEVFGPFAQTIDERAAAKETVETHDLKLDEAEIVEADMSGRTARVTVKLVSHQLSVTRAMDGSIVDGDPDHPVEKTDYWTFARDTRSSDPNWSLVATSSG